MEVEREIEISGSKALEWGVDDLLGQFSLEEEVVQNVKENLSSDGIREAAAERICSYAGDGDAYTYSLKDVKCVRGPVPFAAVGSHHSGVMHHAEGGYWIAPTHCLPAVMNFKLLAGGKELEVEKYVEMKHVDCTVLLIDGLVHSVDKFPVLKVEEEERVSVEVQYGVVVVVRQTFWGPPFSSGDSGQVLVTECGVHVILFARKESDPWVGFAVIIGYALTFGGTAWTGLRALHSAGDLLKEETPAEADVKEALVNALLCLAPMLPLVLLPVSERSDLLLCSANSELANSLMKIEPLETETWTKTDRLLAIGIALGCSFDTLKELDRAAFQKLVDVSEDLRTGQVHRTSQEIKELASKVDKALGSHSRVRTDHLEEGNVDIEGANLIINKGLKAQVEDRRGTLATVQGANLDVLFAVLFCSELAPKTKCWLSFGSDYGAFAPLPTKKRALLSDRRAMHAYKTIGLQVKTGSPEKPPYFPRSGLPLDLPAFWSTRSVTDSDVVCHHPLICEISAWKNLPRRAGLLAKWSVACKEERRGEALGIACLIGEIDESWHTPETLNDQKAAAAARPGWKATIETNAIGASEAEKVKLAADIADAEEQQCQYDRVMKRKAPEDCKVSHVCARPSHLLVMDKAFNTMNTGLQQKARHCGIEDSCGIPERKAWWDARFSKSDL